MNSLVLSIKYQMEINFINLEIAIKTYDRNSLLCGAYAWRYAYHTIHSCDKWFINPFDYKEPDFHSENMDNPDIPCNITITDSELLSYLEKVKNKIFKYLDNLNDEDLYKYPPECKYTVLELILGQFRHMMFHTGMLNGITISEKGKFPMFAGLAAEKYQKDVLFDE